MTNDAPAFAKAMLEEAGVAATPGVDFDAERGHRYMRFCYAGHDRRHGRGRAPSQGVVASARARPEAAAHYQNAT